MPPFVHVRTLVKNTAVCHITIIPLFSIFICLLKSRKAQYFTNSCNPIQQMFAMDIWFCWKLLHKEAIDSLWKHWAFNHCLEMLSPLKYRINQKDLNASIKKGSNHYEVKQTHLIVDHHLQGCNVELSHLVLLVPNTWCNECTYATVHGSLVSSQPTDLMFLHVNHGPKTNIRHSLQCKCISKSI